MSSKINTLITRTKTAVIFVSVMIAGIAANIYTYTFLMMLVMLMSLWEYFKLYQNDLKNNRFNKAYFYISAIVALLAFIQSVPLELMIKSKYIEALLWLMPFTLLIVELFSHSEKPFQNISLILLAYFYVVLPITMLNTIIYWKGQFQPLIPLGIILLIWTNDAFAYLAGSAFGKHKIIPRISPGKTWEGTIGGIVFNFIVAYLLTILFGVFSFTQWAIIAAIVSVFATLGDWVESMMKRSLNVKDSGNLMPGHGGMLDRFDAFFFAVPFVVAYIQLFVK